MLDGVYRRSTEGEPVFVEVPAPADEALQAVLHKIRRGGENDDRCSWRSPEVGPPVNFAAEPMSRSALTYPLTSRATPGKPSTTSAILRIAL